MVFCKGYSNKHTLRLLIQSWKKELYSSGLVETVLMDLLKAHDCLPHDLLIVKFETNGLNKCSLNLVNDYSCFGKQRT